jgi:hypothetical protein
MEIASADTDVLDFEKDILVSDGRHLDLADLDRSGFGGEIDNSR